jgi:Selenocysteine-specific translation elongation factor
VRGVGPVAIGFAYTDVRIHDKLVALPSGVEVDVKNIQILDEDQEEAARRRAAGRLQAAEGIHVCRLSYTFRGALIN